MKYTLDTPVLDFDDTAFLSILTDTPSYALADDLNHLYDLSLHRVEDAVVDDGSLPLYKHADALRGLTYWLVELRDEGCLLIVRGGASREVALLIEDDFGTPVEEPHPADLPAVRRYAILLRYQRQLTPVSIVDFTGDEMEAATQKNLPPRNQKTLRARAARVDLFARILDCIDLRGEGGK